MTLRCFFAEWIDPAERQALLTDQTAHHVKNVLRLKPGEMIELRDGTGSGWTGIIEEATERAVRIRLTEPLHHATESPLDITLGLALARPDRMDLVVRQATEIGLTRLFVFKAERSRYQLTPGQGARRRDRWIKIAREAVCQCGRMRAPDVLVCGNWSDFLHQSEGVLSRDMGVLRILAAEKDAGGNVLSVWQACPMYRQVLAVVGPEGGWTVEELKGFMSSGFQPVRLGPRILRFETAATVLLALVQTLWGDFGQPVEEGQAS